MGKNSSTSSVKSYRSTKSTRSNRSTKSSKSKKSKKSNNKSKKSKNTPKKSNNKSNIIYKKNHIGRNKKSIRLTDAAINSNNRLKGYISVDRENWKIIPKGSHIRYKRMDGTWCLGGFVKKIWQAKNGKKGFELERGKPKNPNYLNWYIYFNNILDVRKKIYYNAYLDIASVIKASKNVGIAVTSLTNKFDRISDKVNRLDNSKVTDEKIDNIINAVNKNKRAAISDKTEIAKLHQIIIKMNKKIENLETHNNKLYKIIDTIKRDLDKKEEKIAKIARMRR